MYSADEAAAIMTEILQRLKLTDASGKSRDVYFRKDAAFYNLELMDFLKLGKSRSAIPSEVKELTVLSPGVFRTINPKRRKWTLNILKAVLFTEKSNIS